MPDDTPYPTEDQLGAILRARIGPLQAQLDWLDIQRRRLSHEIAALRLGAHALDRRGHDGKGEP